MRHSCYEALRSAFTLRIAVVGNGPVDPCHAAEIDAHDIAIRFNGCGTYGTSGYRTDVLVLTNTGKPAQKFARDDCAIHPDALASAKSFWLARSPELVAAERVARPDDASCWTTCDDDIIRYRIGSRPWQYIPADIYWSAKRKLDQHGGRSDDHPSTGMLALLHIRRAYSGGRRRCRVTLYGFTHQGWCRHPWSAERTVIDGWQDWISRAGSG